MTRLSSHHRVPEYPSSTEVGKPRTEVWCKGNGKKLSYRWMIRRNKSRRSSLMLLPVDLTRAQIGGDRVRLWEGSDIDRTR